MRGLPVRGRPIMTRTCARKPYSRSQTTILFDHKITMLSFYCPIIIICLNCFKTVVSAYVFNSVFCGKRLKNIMNLMSQTVKTSEIIMMFFNLFQVRMKSSPITPMMRGQGDGDEYFVNNIIPGRSISTYSFYIIH